MHSFNQLKLLGLIFFSLCVLAAGLYFSNSLFQGKVPSSQAELLATSKNSSMQYFKIPLNFEKNMGQIDPDVKYLAKGHGYSFYFTPQEIVMVLKRGMKKESTHTPSLLRLQFVGANQNPSVLGIEELACKSNYLIGNDPSKWQTDIANFGRVQYEELYPGIDALFYGCNEHLEYDLCLSPYANAELARLRIEGAQNLIIDDSGILHIQIEDGEEVQMKKPIVYQTFSGEKVFIKSDFVLLAYNEVGFSLGQYDRSAHLIIDPVIAYSTYINGSEGSFGNSIAVDPFGKAYMAGSTFATDYPTKNPFQANNAGTSNAIISKFDPSLSGAASLIYSTYLGGNDFDAAGGIAVDSTGKAYVTGTTSSTNFPITPSAFQTTNPSDPTLSAVFVTVFNSSGNGLLYSTYLGGIQDDFGFGIAIDSVNNVYVTGSTFSSNFPTVNPFQDNLNGVADLFFSKLDSSQSGAASLLYSTYLGGSEGDTGTSIAVDSDDNAYITGYTYSSDFPIKNAFQTMLNGFINTFIAKFDPTQIGPPSLLYSSYLGGSGTDFGNGIAVDSAHNAYITGSTSSKDFPIANAFQSTLAGNQDAFITKIDSTPSIVYSSYLGGSSIDFGFSIAVDSAFNAYLTGGTQSSNFPTLHAFQNSLNGETDAFVVKIASAPSIVYSSYLGGADGFSSGNGIALDFAGNAYITGSTSSTSFPTVNAFQTSLTGFIDPFVAKITIIIPSVTSITPACGPLGGGTIVTITGSNFIGATAVHFGTVAASSFTIVDDNHITAISPAQGAGVVHVTVTNPDFTSSTSPSDQFIYTTPVINGLSPTLGCQKGGTSVVITGTGFNGTTAVHFGPASATSFTVNSDSQITTISPPGSGVVNVTVTTTCGGTSAISTAGQFTYIPPPSVTKLSISSACQTGGNTLIITGANFTGATAVNFGSASSPSFTVDSDTQITATIPPGTAGTLNVTVKTPCGTSAVSEANQFTYLQSTSVIVTAPKTAPLGQPLLLTASVSPSSATGSVTFFDGTVALGTSSLVNGKATLGTSFNVIGEHILSAVYSGDSKDCSSTSSTVTLTVITALPPSHLEGFQRINKFATQEDIVNNLKWRAPKKGTPIAYYNIYRDKQLKKLIAKIPSNSRLHFEDHNRKKGKTYAYYIVSIDEFGNVSAPAKVSIRPQNES